MVCFSLHPYRMADVALIKDLAANLIMALDKYTSPNDIIEGFEDALDEYEELINRFHVSNTTSTAQ
jgi:uncharacterized membrane protein YukC